MMSKIKSAFARIKPKLNSTATVSPSDPDSISSGTAETNIDASSRSSSSFGRDPSCSNRVVEINVLPEVIISVSALSTLNNDFKINRPGASKPAKAPPHQVIELPEIYYIPASIPSPPATASSRRNAGNSNRVIPIQSSADLPINIPSSSSSEDEDDDDRHDNDEIGEQEGHASADIQIEDDQDAENDGQGNNVVNDVEAQRPAFSFWQNPYLIVVLKVYYYLGVAPYNFAVETEKQLQLKFWHTVLYILLTSVALINCLEYFKYRYLFEDDEGDKTVVKYYIILLYAIANILYPLSVQFVIWKNKELLTTMVDVARDAWEIVWETASKNIAFQRWVLLTQLASTILTAFLLPVLVPASICGYQPLEILKVHASLLSHSINVWGREDNETAVWDEFEGDITFKTVAMGMTRGIKSMIGGAYGDLLKDVPFWLAITLCSLTTNLSLMLKNSSVDAQQRQKIWKVYQFLKVYSNLVHEIFEFPMQLLHFDHLLFASRFLLDTIIFQERYLYTLLDSYALIRIAAFYIISAKAADMNDTLEVWARANYLMDDIVYETDVIPITATVALDELARNPIGIGRKLFFLNKSFYWKISSIIASCFLFFLESANESVIN